MCLHISQIIFYSNLSFLYLALNHSHPFLSVLSRSQFGPSFVCLGIYSVLHYLETLIHLSSLVKIKSTSFSNYETKVDFAKVTEIQFLYKSHLLSTNQNLQTFILFVGYPDVLVNKIIRCVNKMTFCMQKPAQHLISICI